MAVLIPVSVVWKECFFFPLDGMLFGRKVTHRGIKFAGTHLYPWIEKGTHRVKCITLENNAIQTGREPVNQDVSLWSRTHKSWGNRAIQSCL